VWVCSDDDKLQTLASYPDTPPEKIRVVPNVVDVAAFPPAATAPRRACFTGRIDYPPNYLAARMIVRGLAPLLDDADSLPIVIAGRMAGELFADEPVPSNVTLVSNPRDVPAEVISGSIMVVPLTLGSGSRFKILEAFACGAPVVSTRKGAEGLAVEADTHYLPAATAAEFAAAIKELRSDPRLRGRLTAAARELLEERYSVRSLTQQLRVVANDGRSG
jgi:glycosyltransferase involved in cell wall biosynthesis